MDLTRSKDASDTLIEWVRGKGHVLIVTHDNPDPDALASAFALRHLFLLKTGQDATIAFGGLIGRGENRVMVRKLEICAVPFSAVDLDDFQVVCMVDTQPGTGNNSYPADRPVHVVIDHHPMKRACNDCRWVDIRQDYGASATILFEYLQAQEISIGTKLATILFYAIKSETQDLGREWVRADRDAYLHLLPLANNRILFDITHPEVPAEYYLYFSKAIRNARIYDEVLVFNLYDIDNPDIVSEMADFLLRVEGVDVALGMGRMGEKEILSFRTHRPEIKAGVLMRAVVDGLGTAGGHGMMAGGQISPLHADAPLQKELEATLTRRLLKELGKEFRRGRRLSPS